MSRKSRLGSDAEAPSTPAARGLQAPQQGLCRLALEFPSSCDQIPKNERLGPSPEKGEGKAEQRGLRAGCCLHKLDTWRHVPRQLLWVAWANPEGLGTRANSNLLELRGHVLRAFEGGGKTVATLIPSPPSPDATVLRPRLQAQGGSSLSHLKLSFLRWACELAGLEAGVLPGSIQGMQNMQPPEINEKPLPRG